MSLETFTAKTKAESAKVSSNFSKVLAMAMAGEDFTALTGGGAVTFTTAYKFRPNSIKIFKNGLRLRKGVAADYIEVYDVDGNGISFTLAVAPPSSTPLLADYQKANVDL